MLTNQKVLDGGRVNRKQVSRDFILDFNLAWFPEYIKNSLPNNKNRFKKQAKDLKTFFKEDKHMANKLMKIFS